jgi:hypothetical protein
MGVEELRMKLVTLYVISNSNPVAGEDVAA